MVAKLQAHESAGANLLKILEDHADKAATSGAGAAGSTHSTSATGASPVATAKRRRVTVLSAHTYRHVRQQSEYIRRSMIMGMSSNVSVGMDATLVVTCAS